MAVVISGLDYQGRGVARDNGQVLFIEGALPNELVTFTVRTEKKRFAEATAAEIIEPSPERVAPECSYYAQCGGCALQHLNFAAEVREKNTLWQTQLERLGGGLQADTMGEPIVQAASAYRSRARLAVSYRGRKAAVGFRARASHDVVGITDCPMLMPALAAALPSLPALLAQLPPAGGLSLSQGDAVCALSLQGIRGKADTAVLQAWAASQPAPWQVWLDGRCIVGEAADLFYTLPEFSVQIGFAPDDFTQVNTAVNRALVQQAVQWLAPEGKTVMDFFAGLGNFSLPFARAGADVTAVEAVQEMVVRGRQAAADNGLENAVANRRADLFAIRPRDTAAWLKADAWFLDPPRAGAQALAKIAAAHGPARVVYVSCDAASFARDAKILHHGGYRLRMARTANMFPRTAHIESIALFER